MAKLVVLAIFVCTFSVFSTAQNTYGANAYAQAIAAANAGYASSSAYSDAYNGNPNVNIQYLPNIPWAPLYCRPDEELYGCINGGCGRWECSQPESGICIDLVPGGCIPGCRCREPLLRTEDGRCVPSNQCPPPRCGLNEFYSCGPACDNVCSELQIRNQTHCDILNVQCNPMCYCIAGHARDANGICIPIEECPEQPKCGENEEYTPYGICQARTCSDLGYPLPCNNPNSYVTTNQGPGCVCKRGYVRDCYGNCIPSTQCPSCGGDPNATSGCGTFCTTCDNYGQSVACIQSCDVNGCACKNGYIYDTLNKKCVLPQNCPPKICKKPNEILGCKNACPARTCALTRFKVLIKCPPPPKKCEQTCVCAPGYFRNDAGDCVTKDQCFPTITCGPNEEYNSCANAGCGRWLCSQTAAICIDVIEGGCKPGCRCKAPLLKTDDGRCVPSDQCPQPQCGVNEEYVQCKDSVCRPQTCGDLGYPLPCLQAIANNNQDSHACNQGPGCVCKDGFVRDSNGNCIPVQQCPSCGGDPNATTGCGTFCTTCDNYGQDVACILSCQLNGCACRDKYVYDTVSKKCVLPENCPPKICNKPNEISGCNNTCPPRTCEGKDRIYECPLQPLTPQPCVQQCICAPGYYRNTAGDCVTKDQCPPNIICGPDEEYNGCSNGGCGRWLCSQPGIICIDLIEGYCIPGCRCKEPLLRTDDGRCVPSDQCPQPQCGINEEYVQCQDSICRPQTCGELGSPLPCQQAIADSSQGQPACHQGPGCVCQEGFVRDDNGNCIPSQQCPAKTCNKPNEILGCKNACPSRTCASTRYKELFKCPPPPAVCEPECVCAPDFYRNGAGDCVTRDQCFPNITCGPDEEYNSCANAGCGRWLCSQTAAICIDVIEGGCEPGCRCKAPLLKTDDGRCVPSDQCPQPPKICNQPNEILGCKDDCPPRTCETKDRVYKCLPRPQVCEQQCVCAPGFYRNAGGNCVTKEQCDQCAGPNEFFSCGGACDNVCSELSIRNQTNCDIVNIKCNDKCYCLDGFARDANGICIPIKQCPNPAQCGLNEELVTKPVCRPETCGDLGFPLPCLDPQSGITASHGPGCVCKVGYVRDDNGKCISEKQCSSCGGDPNATTGCGTFCETCDNYGQNAPCILICKSNSCACKDGFIYDTINKKCVSPENCPAKCNKPNEELGCRNNCPPRICESIGKNITCPIVAQVCIPACDCKKGFYRNKAGDCVTEQQCLSTPQCGKNEVYAKAVSCPPQTCLGRLALYKCPLQNATSTDTKYECRCKPGYLRNEIDQCIPADKCSSCKGQNEIYARAETCPPQNCESIRARYDCSKFKPPSKEFECRCKPGFFRNKINECISTQECERCTGPNEYFSCGPACDNVCSELSIRNQTNCDIVNVKCNDMCYCLKGYARDANGICIPIKDCPRNPPRCTGPNEYFSCGPACDNVCSELSIRNQTNCDIVNVKCNDMCYCRKGYARDANGICIPIKDCPRNPPRCTGPNEYFSCGPACDNVCSELSIRNQTNCDIVNVKCNDMCYCRKGYARDANGICIPIKDCPRNPPRCTGPNEYFSCGPACDNVCSELSIRNQTNCDIVNVKCNDMCYCRKGYARDANGICIPIKDCPRNPPQCGPNQDYVECPEAACRPKTCAQVGSPIACPSLCSCPSKPGCICSVGYVEDKDGNCIPESACSRCGPNQELVDCQEAVCRPKTCDQLGFPIHCPYFSSCPTKPGCICIEGYVKHKNGTCIPNKACSSCGGDANAVSGCGVYCGSKCTNNTYVCPKICYYNSCDCKPGFLLDAVLNKCVVPEKCTCGPNEVFSKCTNRACHRSNCAQLSIPWVCRPVATPSTPDASCLPGCECISGYLRNANGVCIPQNQCPEAKNNQTDGNVNAAAQLEKGNGVFTTKFLYEAVKNNPGQSVVISPLSVLFLLAQLSIFATGVALEQLKALLNLISPEQIRGTIPPYLISFNSEQNITLRFAERVYGSEKYPFSDSFKEVTKNVFLAEAQNVNFSNPKEAANIINTWIASQTNNLIQNLVPENSLSANTRLVLTNAIYFKGNWSKPFKKENTQPKDFYVSNSKAVTVQMMNQVSKFKYGVMPKSQAQVVELPYLNENVTLLVVLPPKTADGMDTLLNEQLDFTSITSVLSKLQYKKVNLSLPSFSTKTRTDLKYILEKAGVKQIFNPYDSGLSGIFAKPENVSVSYASQLATIGVDEFGAEAAAGNAIIVGVTSVGVIEDPIDFNADHDFLYYLLLKGNPMFCGKYAGPQ